MQVAVRYKTQWMEEADETCWGFSPKLRVFFCGFLAVAFTVLALTVIVIYGMDVMSFYSETDERSFSASVEAVNIFSHLESLEQIALQHNNSRSINLGYNASVEYVVDQLEPYADYFDVWQQYFDVEQSRNLAEAQMLLTQPEEVAYTYGTDFISMEYSGSGNVTDSAVTDVGEGCDATAYAAFTGGVALAVKTSTCRVRDQAAVAETAGVTGLLIYNNNDGLFTSSAKRPYDFPIFALSHEVGTYMAQTLFTATPVSVSLYSLTEVYITVTSNVLAQTKGGLQDSVIVTGSHLDSVPDGPGINDNGSGSSANLEIALQFAKQNIQPANSVIFAWWAAEELGLKGSTHYVAEMVASGDIKDIAVNLNYDMIASANYFRGVYNGTQATDPALRTQCESIMGMYESWFLEHDFAFGLTEFDGRSDYGPFLEQGIAAGGLFTGAEQLKTEQERELFKGLANSPYDSCYHKECDTVENINRQGLMVMADVAAQIVYDLAMQQNLRAFLNGTQ